MRSRDVGAVVLAVIRCLGMTGHGHSFSKAAPRRPPINAFVVEGVLPTSSLDDFGRRFLDEIGIDHTEWLKRKLAVYLLREASEDSVAIRYIAEADETLVPGTMVRIATAWNDAAQWLSNDPKEAAAINAVERLERLHTPETTPTLDP